MTKVFLEGAVKHNPRFFLAGRGGETNLHKANSEVRRLVLGNAEIYASLSPRERGQKFSRQLLDDDLAGFTFVVKLSYFWKNFENGKIAANKLESVVSEHGSISALEGLPSSAYVTIGEAWCLNIIGAILRQASCRMDIKKAKASTPSKSKSSRRRACSKRSSKVNARIQDQVEDDASQNSAEFLLDTSDQQPEVKNTAAPSPSILPPEEVKSSLPPKTFQTSCGQSPVQPWVSELNVAGSFTKARRVSFCPGASAQTCKAPVQSMSLREALPFFPTREYNVPEQTLSTRFVSFDDIPEVSPNAFASTNEEPSDPFDVILQDWDTDKWPQLDFHDLLSV